MAGAVGNLVPWKPGQSGNPKGYSEGRRKAKRLREALDALLEEGIPPELLDQLDSKTLELLPEGITFAELLALRAVMIGGFSRDHGDVLAAVRSIFAATEKPDPIGKPPTREAPVLPTTEERRSAVLEQLGITEDDEGGDDGESDGA